MIDPRTSLPEEWSDAAFLNFRRARKKRIEQELSWDDFPDDGTRWIPLLHNACTVVDESNYDFLNQWNWSLNNWGYAIRRINGIGILMHREITQCPDGLHVDHINHNTLDNRRKNLRHCTIQQNQFNRIKRGINTTSQYKGVSYDRSRRGWAAFGRIGYKTKNLGRFSSEEEAARAYDEWAKSNYGEFHQLNFPLK